ncbi:BTAD domain-containing putative transcriptional regulator [Actinoplanes sp. L3-i22]|uniref:AfsR/SARP family transcriptional regulator n=1 Tax=Actinoplanes sp. L3-i22 TaxID=2836373 RepID=UPI001C7825B3|nr:BTAD domain-containing putative transcriptional regulator [Actinoplanes sp. L3-i22]BCY09983.1 hypothetical protein L3i22_050710 [Actinoplanes sp. L3-i22]
MSTSQLSFTVLGAVRARHGAHEIDLGPPQCRALLTVLLIAGGEPVSVPELVDTMWGPRAPASAVNAVHRNVGLLRRRLEPGLAARAPGGWLRRVGGGYRLRADAGTLDLLRFRELAGQARRRSAAGFRAEAAARYADALAVWHGPLADGIAAELREHPAFRSVERERTAVARAAAAEALSCRDGDRLLPAIEAAAGRDPFDEVLQARLVLLLAASGQQARALHVYRRVRERLAEELGIDPGAALTEARDRVLRPGPAHPARLRASAAG